MPSLGTFTVDFDDRPLREGARTLQNIENNFRAVGQESVRFERSQRNVGTALTRNSRSYREISRSTQVTAANQRALNTETMRGGRLLRNNEGILRRFIVALRQRLQAQRESNRAQREANREQRQTNTEQSMANQTQNRLTRGTISLSEAQSRGARVWLVFRNAVVVARNALQTISSAINSVRASVSQLQEILRLAEQFRLFGNTLVRLRATFDRFADRFSSFVDRLSRGRRITGAYRLELDNLQRSLSRGEITQQEFTQQTRLLDRAMEEAGGSTRVFGQSLTRLRNQTARGLGIGRIAQNVMQLNTAFQALAGVAASAFVLRSLSRGLSELGRIAAEDEIAVNKLAATFQDSLIPAQMAIAGLTQELGLSTEAVRGFFATFGDQLLGLGASSSELTTVLSETSELAQALALSTGRSFEDVADRISKALLGTSTESAQALGLILNVEEVQRYADTLGVSIDQVSRAERAQLTLNLAYMQSGAALAAFTRNQDTLAGDTQRLGESFRTLTAAIGRDLLPIFRAVVQGVRVIVDLLNRIPGPVRLAIALFVILTVGVGATSIAFLALTKAVVAFGVALGVATGGIIPILGAIIAGISALAGVLAAVFNRRTVRAGEALIETFEDLGIATLATSKELGRFANQLERLSRRFRRGKLDADEYVGSIATLARELGLTADEFAALAASGDLADTFDLNRRNAEVLGRNVEAVTARLRELEAAAAAAAAATPEAAEEAARRAQEIITAQLQALREFIREVRTEADFQDAVIRVEGAPDISGNEFAALLSQTLAEANISAEALSENELRRISESLAVNFVRGSAESAREQADLLTDIRNVIADRVVGELRAVGMQVRSLEELQQQIDAGAETGIGNENLQIVRRLDNLLAQFGLQGGQLTAAEMRSIIQNNADYLIGRQTELSNTQVEAMQGVEQAVDQRLGNALVRQARGIESVADLLNIQINDPNVNGQELQRRFISLLEGQGVSTGALTSEQMGTLLQTLSTNLINGQEELSNDQLDVLLDIRDVQRNSLRELIQFNDQGQPDVLSELFALFRNEVPEQISNALARQLTTFVRADSGTLQASQLRDLLGQTGASAGEQTSVFEQIINDTIQLFENEIRDTITNNERFQRQFLTEGFGDFEAFINEIIQTFQTDLISIFGTFVEAGEGFQNTGEIFTFVESIIGRLVGTIFDGDNAPIDRASILRDLIDELSAVRETARDVTIEADTVSVNSAPGSDISFGGEVITPGAFTTTIGGGIGAGGGEVAAEGLIEVGDSAEMASQQLQAIGEEGQNFLQTFFGGTSAGGILSLFATRTVPVFEAVATRLPGILNGLLRFVSGGAAGTGTSLVQTGTATALRPGVISAIVGAVAAALGSNRIITNLSNRAGITEQLAALGITADADADFGERVAFRREVGRLSRQLNVDIERFAESVRDQARALSESDATDQELLNEYQNFATAFERQVNALIDNTRQQARQVAFDSGDPSRRLSDEEINRLISQYIPILAAQDRRQSIFSAGIFQENPLTRDLEPVLLDILNGTQDTNTGIERLVEVATQQAEAQVRANTGTLPEQQAQTLEVTVDPEAFTSPLDNILNRFFRDAESNRRNVETALRQLERSFSGNPGLFPPEFRDLLRDIRTISQGGGNTETILNATNDFIRIFQLNEDSAASLRQSIENLRNSQAGQVEAFERLFGPPLQRALQDVTDGVSSLTPTIVELNQGIGAGGGEAVRGGVGFDLTENLITRILQLTSAINRNTDISDEGRLPRGDIDELVSVISGFENANIQAAISDESIRLITDLSTRTDGLEGPELELVRTNLRIIDALNAVNVTLEGIDFSFEGFDELATALESSDIETVALTDEIKALSDATMARTEGETASTDKVVDATLTLSEEIERSRRQAEQAAAARGAGADIAAGFTGRAGDAPSIDDAFDPNEIELAILGIRERLAASARTVFEGAVRTELQAFFDSIDQQLLRLGESFSTNVFDITAEFFQSATAGAYNLDQALIRLREDGFLASEAFIALSVSILDSILNAVKATGEQALIQSLVQLAAGFVALATGVGNAPAHFTASAIYAGIAGAAAVATGALSSLRGAIRLQDGGLVRQNPGGNLFGIGNSPALIGEGNSDEVVLPLQGQVAEEVGQRIADNIPINNRILVQLDGRTLLNAAETSRNNGQLTVKGRR